MNTKLWCLVCWCLMLNDGCNRKVCVHCRKWKHPVQLKKSPFLDSILRLHFKYMDLSLLYGYTPLMYALQLFCHRHIYTMKLKNAYFSSHFQLIIWIILSEWVTNWCFLKNAFKVWQSVLMQWIFFFVSPIVPFYSPEIRWWSTLSLQFVSFQAESNSPLVFILDKNVFWMNCTFTRGL